jgi:hypothetical protein
LRFVPETIVLGDPRAYPRMPMSKSPRIEFPAGFKVSPENVVG